MITLVLKEKGEPRTLKLTVDAISLGRSSENTIALTDRKVSRLHAKIERIGATYQIRDLDSGNGTKVNGKKIDFYALSSGDEIRVGDTTLVVQGFDDEMDEDEDVQDSPDEAAEKTPVPLPQKLQVKDKINQVKNLNSEGHDEAPPPPESPPSS